MWVILCVIVFHPKVCLNLFPFVAADGALWTTFKFLYNYLPPSVVISHLRVSIYKLISIIVRSLIILLIQTLIILMAVNNGM